MLQAHALSLQRGAQCIIAPLSLALPSAQVSALLGPNGAGKSSLLHLLAGGYAPTTGAVTLSGRSLASYTSRALALQRAVLAQHETPNFPWRVDAWVQLGGYPRHSGDTAAERAVVAAALDLVELGHCARRELSTLSGGERRRAQLARALVQIWPMKPGPRWLLLDEPLNHLDLAWGPRVMRLLHELSRTWNLTVLLVLHEPNLALRYADWVYLLAAGQLVAQGQPAAVLTPAQLSAVYQTPVCWGEALHLG